MVEKGYQGRSVAVGRLDGNAFVAYVLASRSDSERSVRAVPEKNRIEIYAVGGAVDRIRAAAEYPYDGAHNL